MNLIDYDKTHSPALSCAGEESSPSLLSPSGGWGFGAGNGIGSRITPPSGLKDPLIKKNEKNGNLSLIWT